MTLDLCERWRAEQERRRRVHAAQRLSRDPGPSRSRSRSRSPNSRRSSSRFISFQMREEPQVGTRAGGEPSFLPG